MIRLENISFGYVKKTLLFNGLSLNIQPGAINGLLGKNGAGKTTLLKIIAGLRQVNSGNCLVMGYNPFERNTEFYEQLYFVPEELYLPSVSIRGYVRQFAGFYPNFNHEALYNYIHSFDLTMDMHLGKLSYGQKKKFALSFAMASGTRLVIFDEPTNGLDIPSKSVFRKLAASAISDERAFLISTHQVRDLNKLIEGVLLLDKGQILLSSQVYEIASKYSFITLSRKYGEEDVLYSEEHIEGIKAIVPAREGIETDVDLELLFNAVVLGNVKLN